MEPAPSGVTGASMRYANMRRAVLPWLIAAALIYATFSFPLIPDTESLLTKIGVIVTVAVITALRKTITRWLFD